MDTVKLIRAAQIDLLNEVKRICQKNGIDYFLSEGTLIGAIRHNGFIPWDDDIDVAMLRENYDRFQEACKTDLDPDYVLLDWHTDPNSPLPFMKLKIKGTHYREEIMAKSDADDAIFIDIFPLDNVPESSKLRKKQKQRTNVIFKIILVRCGYDLAQGSFPKKLIYTTLNLLSRIRSVGSWKKAYEKAEMRYNSQKTTHVDLVFSRLHGRFSQRRIVEDLSEHVFENGVYAVPRDYDTYLRRIYGDYMQLPPEDQQVGLHAVYQIDLGSYTIRSTKL